MLLDKLRLVLLGLLSAVALSSVSALAPKPAASLAAEATPTVSASQSPAPRASLPAGTVVSIAAWDECLMGQGVSVPEGYDPYANPQPHPKLHMTSQQQSACDANLPPAPFPSAETQKKAWDQVNCLRAHGIAVGDPTFGPGNWGYAYGPGVGPLSPGFHPAHDACGVPWVGATPQ